MVVVARVSRTQEGEATALRVGLGLKVKIERAFGGFFGTVRLQSVDPGTEAPMGSTITLTVV